MDSEGGIGTPHSPEDGVLGHSAAKSGDPTPFGTLAMIPRELRDEIYRLSLAVERSHLDACFCGTASWDRPCCNEGYASTCYMWYPPSLAIENRKRKASSQKWGGGSFSLLGVSSSIRTEALHALRTWGHFMFPEPYLGRKVERYDIPFLHFISDLRLRFIIDQPDDGWLGDPLWCTTSYQSTIDTPAYPLSYFTGHDAHRKTCAIEIWYSRSLGLHKLLQSPLCNAIRGLTGFENVILIFVYEKESSWDQYGDESGMIYDRTDITAFSALTTTFSTALGNELGPSTSTNISDRWQWRIMDMFHHTLETSIEFHPRTYRTRGHVPNESS